MLKWITPLILIPSLAFGSAGTISEFTGSGVLEREQSVIDGGTGVGVNSMDTAVTENGRMRIDFVDETRVDITEHSRLLIDDFVYDPNSGKGSLGIRATLGTVRYASGQIAHNSRRNVNIRTPSATIGVRGTDFVMVVDEAGGSTVTLLPSCDISGYCVTGEISVENDAGYVILNQAFQMTRVQSAWTTPTTPLVVDLDERDINNLLIIRREHPYDAEKIRAEQEAAKLTDFLNIDFLEFDGLDGDALSDSIADIWVTDLDKTDSYLAELLVDMIDQYNIALAALFRSELDRQNEEIFKQIDYGYDEETGITLEDKNPYYRFHRLDNAGYHTIDIRLSQQYGYQINLEQQDEAIYDYRIGVGNNTIDIRQVQ
jgi:hypothetical protein